MAVEMALVEAWRRVSRKDEIATGGDLHGLVSRSKGAGWPNDPKLSDRGGWRDGCMVAERRRPEAASVTAGAVRCSAWLGRANSRTKCNTVRMVGGRGRRSRMVANSGRRVAMKYKQLNAEERGVLAALRTLGLNQAEIGRELGRHRCTIGGELKGNSAPYDGGYRSKRAHQRAHARRYRSRRNSHFQGTQWERV